MNVTKQQPADSLRLTAYVYLLSPVPVQRCSAVCSGGPCISRLRHQWRHIKSTLNEYTSDYPQYDTTAQESIQSSEIYHQPTAFLCSLQTCSSVECWRLRCTVGLLQRGASALLTLRSRVWAETFIEVSAVTVCLSVFTYCPLLGGLWNRNLTAARSLRTCSTIILLSERHLVFWACFCVCVTMWLKEIATVETFCVTVQQCF